MELMGNRTQDQRMARAKKMLLWFGMGSLFMGFAGLTSAYIVSSSREDWLHTMQLPKAFLISTLVIVLSSGTYILAKRSLKAGKSAQCTQWLWVTLGLGLLFLGLQYWGFYELVSQGYYFTGPTSSIRVSYVFMIAAAHMAHVIAGLVSLVVVLINQMRGRYTAESHLGLTLGATFWHFLDLLWVYLVLFMFLVG